MDVEAEAIIVVGGLALLAGALLYLPFYIWIKRRKMREGASPQGRLAVRITKAGIIFYGAMTVALLVGYAQGSLHPETPIGKFMKHPLGSMLYSICVMVATVTLGAFLTKRGYVFIKEVKPEVPLPYEKAWHRVSWNPSEIRIDVASPSTTSSTTVIPWSAIASARFVTKDILSSDEIWLFSSSQKEPLARMPTEAPGAQQFVGELVSRGLLSLNELCGTGI